MLHVETVLCVVKKENGKVFVLRTPMKISVY